MKIAVIGAGAMGSVYAALLADAGHDVWAIDIWRQHLDAIREHGLRLEGASGDRVVKTISVGDHVRHAGRCDLYILATKASGVAAAAASVAPLMDAYSLLLTIQNGLGAGDRIAAHMPTDNVLLGVADGFGASLRGPGHAHHTAMNLIRIGEMHGGLTPRLERLVAIWRAAGFNARAFANIEQLIWEKFICNVTFSGPCTVFDRTLRELMGDAETWRIACACALEAFTLAQAKGVALSFTDPVAYVQAFGESMPDARPSMLLDHHAGRLSEIDALNGMVPIIGHQLGIATPYNEVLSAVVRSRESRFGRTGSGKAS